MECIITPYFWASLWPAAILKPDTLNHPLKYLGLQLDHSVPISLLLFDWLFLSAKPFVKRHFSLCLIISIFYLVINITSTKITGTPVYAAMTWNGIGGVIIPLAFIPGGTLIFFILYFLTYIKLKLNFNNKML